MTNQDTFFVPFSVSTSTPETAPKCVELHVSGDKGKNWSLYQERSPQEGRFSFRAGVDGEFWFAMRAIDAVGKPHPAGIGRPEMIVIVDREHPAMELAVSPSPDGKFTAHWRAIDPHLKGGSLSLAYRLGDEAEWHPVAIQPASPVNGVLVGQTAWPLAAGNRLVEVRATVRDEAGNAAVVSRQLPPPAGPVVAASPPGSEIPLPAPLDPTPSPTNRPLESMPPLVSSGTPAPPPSSNDVPSSEGWVENPHVTTFESSPIATTTPKMEGPHGFSGAVPHPSEAGRPQPPVGSPQSPVKSGPVGPSGSAGAPLWSSSRRFNLDYHLEAARPDDIYRVEVWQTDDGGRTWRHLGDDDDRISPYLVSVLDDGNYGFRLLVQGKEGFAARPPRMGDPADIWVRVDATPPTVRITSAKYGRGNHAGMLQIAWEAQDQWLSEVPITLMYGENPYGPWRKIAGPLPNSGQYDWPVDDRVPEKIYLRIEASDQAGNQGQHTLVEPIHASGLAPRARIRAIRPATGLLE